jgi:hypothetical protein
MVNKRVYFLLKKRLTTEVGQEPPLFPWETEVQDYSNDSSGDLTAAAISPVENPDEKNQIVSGNNTEAPPPAS